MERRGPAICNVSNIGEGKDEMTKASDNLQDLRRRIYVKAIRDRMRKNIAKLHLTSGMCVKPT